MANILIVEDEAAIRKVVSLLLVEHGHQVTSVDSAEDASDRLRDAIFDVLLLDVNLPRMTGLELLAQVRNLGAPPTCIVMTAYGSIRSAVDAMREGAFDYLTKPFDNDQLLLSVDRALVHRNLRAEVESLRSELQARNDFPEIIGASAPMREVFRVMHKVAGAEATVLVLGESGTGKELVARGIHRHSRRADGPFVAVNCSAIPATLIEAEFFGFERGAFTDARETRMGKFEQAHGGTLFLDEIGDLAFDAQAKLLRALQERQVTRIGGRRPVPADVRVVGATNKNLEAAVAKGEFREDLYFRLNVLSVPLPPLRERGEDLPALIDDFLRRFTPDPTGPPMAITPEARRLLLAHDWPGNVRELENAIQRAVVLADGPAVRAADLPSRIRGGDPAASESGRLTMARAVTRAVERVERGLIQAALTENRGSRTLAAEQLDINRKTLFNKMRQYGLTMEEQDPD